MKNAQKNTKKYSNYTTGQEMPSGKVGRDIKEIYLFSK